MGGLQILKESYRRKQSRIRARLGEFKRFFNEPFCWTYRNNHLRLIPSTKKHHERLFEELAFCILAANTSAEMGMKAIDSIRHLLPCATPEDMTTHLRGIYRFINVRPQYIVHCRKYLELMQENEGDLHEIFLSIDDPQHLREFLANNSGIKGVGYKEASHFLRNLGFEGYAILDKHIINSMQEAGIIDEAKAPENKGKYLALERKYLDFAQEIGIHPDELDLLLWSEKTGKILK